MNSRNLAVAKVLKFIHLFILAFIVVGPFTPNHHVLICHAVVVPIVALQWALNQNHCLLTQWEYKLRGVSTSEQDEDGFIKTLIGQVLPRAPSPIQMKWGIWTITAFLWVVSVLRLI